MNRVVVASVAVAALVGVGVLGWFDVRQAREFRRLLAVGDAALAHDQMSVAIEAYSGAVVLRPDSMLGWLKRGDTYRRRGEYSPALRDLQQAAALDPTAPRPMELLGDVYGSLGHYARAVELYSRFVALDDRAPRVLYKLALAQYRNGTPGAALDPLRRAMVLDRQMPETHYLLGLIERDSRHPERAIEALSQAVALNPAFAAAREELAALDLSLGRRRDGLEQLDALAALEPDRPERLTDLALAYARAGRFESAVLAMQRAMDRYPDSAPVHRTVARIWLDFAEDGTDRIVVQKAIAALRIASMQDSGSPELQVLRGRAQLLSNDPRAAEQTLQAATASLPVEPAAFRYLATAAERLGHRELARASRGRFEALSD